MLQEVQHDDIRMRRGLEVMQCNTDRGYNDLGGAAMSCRQSAEGAEGCLIKNSAAPIWSIWRFFWVLIKVNHVSAPPWQLAATNLAASRRFEIQECLSPSSISCHKRSSYRDVNINLHTRQRCNQCGAPSPSLSSRSTVTRPRCLPSVDQTAASRCDSPISSS